MDLFDPKPELQKRGGPEDSHSRSTSSSAATPICCSPARSASSRRGQCGMELSELLPHIGDPGRRAVPGAFDAHRARQPHRRHGDAQHRQVHDGPAGAGRLGQLRARHGQPEPAGLRRAARSGRLRHGRLAAWSSGWLPATHGGTEFSSKGAPVPNLRRPATVDAEAQPRRSRLPGEAERSTPPEVPAARPSWRPASAITSWPLACRRRRRGARPVARTGVAAEALRPRRSRDGRLRHRAACWPGDWSRRACASCRSIRTRRARSGTRTASLKTDLEKMCRQDRPADGGADPRSEGPRPAGQHDRPVERRVRPTAGIAERRRPRSQPPRLQPVPGRRRLPAAA